MMREAGKLAARVMDCVREMANPGIRISDVEKAVARIYSETSFPAITNYCINEVISGVSTERILAEGDIFKVDTVCKLNGWSAVRASAFSVGSIAPERQLLLKVAEDTLQLAIGLMSRRKWWSQIAREMQQNVEKSGFSVVTAYVGHGIENPQVPNYADNQTRRFDFKLVPGLVLAVHPMLNMGRPEVETLGDQKIVVTRDGLPSVHLAHTIALTADGVTVLTANE